MTGITMVTGSYEECMEYCGKHLRGGFFEFDFSYVPRDERFREIDRFLWESRHERARFANRYEGSAVIDMTAWNKHFPNEYFDAFMYFLKDSADHLDCALIVCGKCSDSFREHIGRFFELNVIELESSGLEEQRGSGRIGFDVETEENEYDV